MQSRDLLVSSVNITEDDYDYKGLFTLSSGDKSTIVDMAEFDSGKIIKEIKSFFGLEESENTIKEEIMSMVVKKAAISSPVTQGENYNNESEESKVENISNELDMA